MGYTAHHGTEILINETQLNLALKNKQWNKRELHDRINMKYDLDLKYRGFMNTLQNKNQWKLIYAYAIADLLEKPIEELFYIDEANKDEHSE